MRVRSFFLVLLAALLLLAGCSQQRNADETTAPEAPAGAPVVDAYRGTWEMPTTGEVFSHAIPKIELSGDYAEEVNAELFAMYADQLDDEGVLCLSAEYSYEYYVREDLLSLVFRVAYPEQITQDDFSLASQHYVYTLRISDGSRVTPQEVLAMAGVAPEDFYRRAAAALGNAYCLSLPEDVLQEYLGSEPVSEQNAIYTQFAASVSEENAEAALPYLDENGELCFMGEVFQIAGAGRHTQLFSYAREGEVSAYYEVLLGITQ